MAWNFRTNGRPGVTVRMVAGKKGRKYALTTGRSCQRDFQICNWCCHLSVSLQAESVLSTHRTLVQVLLQLKHNRYSTYLRQEPQPECETHQKTRERVLLPWTWIALWSFRIAATCSAQHLVSQRHATRLLDRTMHS